MAYAASPVQFEIHSEAGQAAKITAFDEAASEVTLTETVHTPESWRELSQAIDQALRAIHPITAA